MAFVAVWIVARVRTFRALRKRDRVETILRMDAMFLHHARLEERVLELERIQHQGPRAAERRDLPLTAKDAPTSYERLLRDEL